jgi:uncharacterized protein YndB with AHSA1/START domain
MTTERTVAITRVFDAPRERVFAAWTQAKHLAHWFGPKGFTVPSCEADPRPGGVFRLCMRSPEGKDYWVRGQYREIAPPERLVIACTADDDQGITRLEELIDVTFTQRGGETELKLLATASGPGAEAAAMIEGMPKGWAQTITRLDAHLNPKR